MGRTGRRKRSLMFLRSGRRRYWKLRQQEEERTQRKRKCLRKLWLRKMRGRLRSWRRIQEMSQKKLWCRRLRWIGRESRRLVIGQSRSESWSLVREQSQGGSWSLAREQSRKKGWSQDERQSLVRKQSQIPGFRKSGVWMKENIQSRSISLTAQSW